jgi:hypothetical protein
MWEVDDFETQFWKLNKKFCEKWKPSNETEKINNHNSERNLEEK